MNQLVRTAIAASLLVFLSAAPRALALSAEEIDRAQKILQIVLDLSAKFPTAATNVAAPTPLADRSGAFFLPYNSKGELTEWATKALSAQIGSAVGAKAGEEAGKAVTSKIPFGGLLNGAAKKKGKELGALAAIGGPEFVKSTSDLSFATLEDYAVYLHVKHSGGTDFAKALATAIAIYPDLEKSYAKSVKAAYQRAEAAAKAALK